MADKKISALTSASTPLAGTEVLPIVQSGATVKVAVSSLTLGRTTDVLNLLVNATAPTAASASYNYAKIGTTSHLTGGLGTVVSDNLYLGGGPSFVYDTTAAGAAYQQSGGNHYFYTAASGTAGAIASVSTVLETDASSNFKVNAGNVVIGTSGKGIDFSATPGTGTSELLADYEEGTFTPSLSGATGYSNQVGTYVKIGKIVHFQIQFTVTSGSPIGTITGLPFTSANTDDSSFSSQINVLTGNTSVTYAVGATQLVGYVNRNDTVAYIQSQGSVAVGSITISSTASLYIAGSYISA